MRVDAASHQHANGRRPADCGCRRARVPRAQVSRLSAVQVDATLRVFELLAWSAPGPASRLMAKFGRRRGGTAHSRPPDVVYLSGRQRYASPQTTVTLDWASNPAILGCRILLCWIAVPVPRTITRL